MDEESMTVRKATAYLPISVEMAMEHGLITEEEEARARGWTPRPAPRIPWYVRLRWRWGSWREGAGRKIGGWIAGVDLSETEDWD